MFRIQVPPDSVAEARINAAIARARADRQAREKAAGIGPGEPMPRYVHIANPSTGKPRCGSSGRYSTTLAADDVRPCDRVCQQCINPAETGGT